MMYNVIPLAGPDLEMKDGNFRPLYEVDGQPLIIRTLKSRNWYNEDDNFIFVLRQVDGIDRLKSFLCSNFKNCQTVIMSDLTKGALLSCLSGLSLINNYNEPICVDLADIIYECDFVPVQAFENDPELYGIIPSFKSDNPKFSYLKIENNKIIETKEKAVISDNASSGTYFFKDLPSFLNSISWSLQNEDKVSFKNNLFLCPSYNFFISSGKKIENFEVRNVKPISSIFCDIA